MNCPTLINTSWGLLSSSAYANKEVPHFILIGKDGKIQQVHKGYSSAQLDKIIASVNAALAAQ